LAVYPVNPWATFYGEVLRLAPNGLIAIWPENEISGTVIKCLNNAARNGVYSGPTPNAIAGPHGYGAPQYDAINDFGNIYTPSLETALANWDEGTALAFARVRAASVWIDATVRRAMWIANAAGSTGVSLMKFSTNNQVRVARFVGGVTVAVNYTVPSPPTDWFALAMTWSVANNRLRAWYSSVGVSPIQAGTTQAGPATWSGVTLASNNCLLGATPGPAAMMDGFLGDVLVWNAELDFTTQLSPLMVL